MELQKIEENLIPLSKLKLNKKSIISYIKTKNKSILHKLISIGALPKTEVTLIQNFPSYVFQIGKSQFTVDEELASNIYVKAGN